MQAKMGRYQIRDSLGKGGMREVFRAHDPRLHRDVAIKAIHKDILQRPDSAARFAAEARALLTRQFRAIQGRSQAEGQTLLRAYLLRLP